VGELYALVSAGGSPGVTTAAVALAMTWPSPVIMAECDPSGGDVLAGLLTGHVPARQGLMEHAIEAGRNSAAAAQSLGAQLVALDADRSRMLLPGLTDPRQAAGLASAWPAVTSTLVAQDMDVLADCGRLDAGPGQPLAILSAARLVAVVLRPTLRQVSAARPRMEILTELVGGTSGIALLLTGPGAHSRREVARALGVPVAAMLPDDARSAALFSDGVGSLRTVTSGSLLRSASVAGKALRDHVAAASPAAPAVGAVR
jgi:hypothetical protein